MAVRRETGCDVASITSPAQGWEAGDLRRNPIANPGASTTEVP